MLSPLHPDNFLQHFNRLDQLLNGYQSLWRPSPFHHDPLPWHEQYPELHVNLLALDDTSLEQLSDEIKLFDFLIPFLPEIQYGAELYIPPLQAPLLEADKFTDRNIPGRKLQQILAFSAALKAETKPLAPILDWCSGKGHLARQLNTHLQQPVLCLEYDDQLCHSGRSASSFTGQSLEFIQQDVLDDIDPCILQHKGVYTALHACGDLHRAMLLHAVAQKVPLIALSPCCYPRIKTSHYQPLSQAAHSSTIQLSRQDLRLAVMESATSGARVQRLRQKEQLWRIGFDLLRQSLTQSDHYQSMPSLAKGIFSGDFSDYCHTQAKLIQLSISQPIDSAHWLQCAQKKLDRIRRLEKARLGFRKALEYWLLLDRALYLQEHHYQVTLVAFCPRSITARNTLILARRDSPLLQP